jgi:hypothetical protein
MTHNTSSEQPFTAHTANPEQVEAEDLAAALTEAAFPVALQHGLGTHWLDRELELWNAMTQTVRAWQ